MATKTRPARSRNGSKAEKALDAKAKAPPTITAPDVIGDTGRARIVADLIASCQQDAFHVQGMMVANDAKPEDDCPNTRHVSENRPMTYGERLEQLEGAEERLAEAFADVMPKVEELLAQRAE